MPIVVREFGEKAYEFSENMIAVVIPFNKRVNIPVKTVDKVLELLKGHPYYTQEELAEKIGKTKKTVLRSKNLLKEKGIIKRVGSDKAGHWEIIDEQ